MGSYCIKVNKTMLESGKITLANDEIDSLIDASKWSIGDVKDVSLVLNDKEYNGKIAYRDRNKGNPYYQLSYGKQLNKALKKEFIHTYLAITTEKIPYDENKTYHITTDNINREVLQLKSEEDGSIRLIPFLKMHTEYDVFFKKIIEWNILNLNEKDSIKDSEDIILYSSDWISKKELSKHKEVNNAVYYLVDTVNKEIYIGSCDNIGSRVKPNRKEIPGWDLFKYEIIKPKYWSIKDKIEAHSIRAFASFLDNGANEPYLKISDYKLNNINWAKHK